MTIVTFDDANPSSRALLGFATRVTTAATWGPHAVRKEQRGNSKLQSSREANEQAASGSEQAASTREQAASSNEQAAVATMPNHAPADQSYQALDSGFGPLRCSSTPRSLSSPAPLITLRSAAPDRDGAHSPLA